MSELTYRVFVRAGLDGRKITRARGLSWKEAFDKCQAYNDNRSSRQKARDLMMEFEREQRL
jgi:hypothetical protein